MSQAISIIATLLLLSLGAWCIAPPTTGRRFLFGIAYWVVMLAICIRNIW